MLKRLAKEEALLTERARKENGSHKINGKDSKLSEKSGVKKKKVINIAKSFHSAIYFHKLPSTLKFVIQYYYLN